MFYTKFSIVRISVTIQQLYLTYHRIPSWEFGNCISLETASRASVVAISVSYVVLINDTARTV